MGVGRAFVTSLLAFFISGFAGGLMAQWLAVSTGAGEEYILVFMATVLAAVLATIVFFVAQLLPNPLQAIRIAGSALLIISIALVLFMIGFSYFDAGGRDAVVRDVPFIAGIGTTSIVTIVAHWLFVRWRMRRKTAVLAANA